MIHGLNFRLTIYKNAPASGGRSPPDPLPGFAPGPLMVAWVIKPQLATARLQLHASMMSICLSVCLSVCRQNAKKTRFSQKLSNWELRCLLTTYRKSHMGFSKNPLLDPYKIQDGGDPPRITLQGSATWWIHCLDSRATCHIAGCKNSIRHIENHFSPYFIFIFCF